MPKPDIWSMRSTNVYEPVEDHTGFVIGHVWKELHLYRPGHDNSALVAPWRAQYRSLTDTYIMLEDRFMSKRDAELAVFGAQIAIVHPLSVRSRTRGLSPRPGQAELDARSSWPWVEPIMELNTFETAEMTALGYDGESRSPRTFYTLVDDREHGNDHCLGGVWSTRWDAEKAIPRGKAGRHIRVLELKLVLTPSTKGHPSGLKRVMIWLNRFRLEKQEQKPERWVTSP